MSSPEARGLAHASLTACCSLRSGGLCRALNVGTGGRVQGERVAGRAASTLTLHHIWWQRLGAHDHRILPDPHPELLLLRFTDEELL